MLLTLQHLIIRLDRKHGLGPGLPDGSTDVNNGGIDGHRMDAQDREGQQEVDTEVVIVRLHGLGQEVGCDLIPLEAKDVHEWILSFTAVFLQHNDGL